MPEMDVFMRAAGLVAVLIYLLWSMRVVPERYAPWMQRAALGALGIAILVAVVETVRWFAAR